MSKSRPRIAIVGAGPIGLEAAAFGVRAGFEVQVYERGRVAQNLREWGHVRLFSPFGMNASPWGREAVDSAFANGVRPSGDEVLSGRDFAERYLIPLSRLPELQDRIHENVEVRAIGRTRLEKGDLIGQWARAADGFRLLVADETGERMVEADVVLDCSGSFPNHNWVGAGGIPCVGELNHLTEIEYGLPDILGRNREHYAGRRVMVVGSGYSAATTIVALAELAGEEQGTRAVWITRTGRVPPVAAIENDRLTERDRLARAANDLAVDSHSPIEWRPARVVTQIQRRPPGNGFSVMLQPLSSTDGSVFPPEEIAVDRIVANVGYRPDRRLYEELQIHECYASHGPMKLAAGLLGATSSDCLDQESPGAEALRNPEPGFFILGSKSYGRNPRFLLTIGHEQIRNVYSLLQEKTNRFGNSSGRRS